MTACWWHLLRDNRMLPEPLILTGLRIDS